VAESITGARTKSAASTIRRVLIAPVMIDVRRVVGRENSSSQTTSLFLLACGCGSEQRGVTESKKGLASFEVAGVPAAEVDSSFFSGDELEAGSSDCPERRGARGTVAI